MIKYLVILSLLINSCGRDEQDTPKYNTDLSQLKEKAELYQQLLTTHQDSSGFILTDKCDSLLFSGLLSAAIPGQVNLEAAYENGQWFRRPDKDCSPEIGNSRSTISRDMIIGVFYHLYYNRDLDLAIELMDNLKSNNYLLKGQGSIGELLMTPTMLRTLAEIILYLGGPKYRFELNLPIYFSKDTGFVAHLNVWHIILRYKMNNNNLSNHEISVLEYHNQRQPLNPLFEAAYRKVIDLNYTNVLSLLVSSPNYPEDRLPTTLEICSPWVIERDYSEKDWAACPNETFKEHTGADLLVIYNLILK